MIAHRNGDKLIIPTPAQLLDVTEGLLPKASAIPIKGTLPKLNGVNFEVPGKAIAFCDRTAEMNSLKDQITKLLFDLPKPEGIMSPEDSGDVRIRWTESEAQVVYDLTRQVMLNLKFPPGPEWQDDKVQRTTMMLVGRAACVSFLPPHRWLPFKNILELPSNWAMRFQDLCPSLHDRLPKPVPSALPVSLPAPEPTQLAAIPPAQETPPMPARFGESHVHWDSNEKYLFCLSLAHRMRKRGLQEIPEGTNRGGCGILVEETRATLLALPEGRRRKMTGVMIQLHDPSTDLGGRMIDLFRKPRLPDLPLPMVEKPETNGHSPVTEPVAPGKGEQQPGSNPEPAATHLPVPDAVSKADQAAEIFKDLFAGYLKFDQIEKRLGEVEVYNNLLTEENSGLRGRLDSAEQELTKIRAELIEAKTAKKEEMPRVAIIGCRKDEFDKIVKECTARGIHARFRHYDQDQNPTDVFADYAIMMKWVSHTWDDKVKKAIPRGQFAFTDGGTLKAVGQIGVWLERAPAHATA